MGLVIQGETDDELPEQVHFPRPVLLAFESSSCVFTLLTSTCTHKIVVSKRAIVWFRFKQKMATSIELDLSAPKK